MTLYFYFDVVDDGSLGTQSFPINVPQGFYMTSFAVETSLCADSNATYFDSGQKSGGFTTGCDATNPRATQTNSINSTYPTPTINPAHIDITASNNSLTTTHYKAIIDGFMGDPASFDNIATVQGSSTQPQTVNANIDWSVPGLVGVWLSMLLFFYIMVKFISGRT